MLTNVLVFLLVLAALLAVPVSVDFRLNWQHEFTNELKVSWMFGLVRLRALPAKRIPRVTEGKTANSALRLSADSRKGKSAARLILQQRFRQRVFKYLSDLWHSIQKENLVIRIRAGLGDPADTGQLWAIAGPVTAMLAGVQRHSIILVPDFLSSGLEIGSSGYLRFSPLRILSISIGFLFSPGILLGLRQLSTGR